MGSKTHSFSFQHYFNEKNSVRFKTAIKMKVQKWPALFFHHNCWCGCS